MQYEVYVAMSIRGTNCFITANKTIDQPKRPGYGESITIDNWEFTGSQPRKGKSLRDAQKLIWPQLNENGLPSKNPQYIFERFNELHRAGWAVDNSAFITKHKLDKPQTSASVDTAREPQPRIHRMKDNHKKLELTWIGKESHPRRVEPRVLIEDRKLGYQKSGPGGDNLLILGDNLLALRALESSHGGRIKCIFIDPPYNTGSAFEHYDDGVEHSLWLNLMRQRIEMLHELLSNDGSMWITIDDNESHYLKVLCDEIFGRLNFVTNVVWQKKYTVANDAKWFSDNHDHILVYAKDKQTWRPNKLPRSEEMNARYANPDGHPKGAWKATPLHAKSGSEKSKGFSYTFRNGCVWTPPPSTFPRFSVDTLKRLDEGNELWFGRDGKGKPSRKTFLSELTNEGTPPLTVWLHGEVGHNHEARTEAKSFNDAEVFATPKPERLISRILTIATKPGDLVLDSFAGSGTTGAVAHKMGRRWIMIELGDHAITHCVPRLRKVIEGRDQGGITEMVGWEGGGGYRFYRLAPSLLRWRRQ